MAASALTPVIKCADLQSFHRHFSWPWGFCRLETYNNIIQRSEFSIFIFKILKSSSLSTVEQACNKFTSSITGDTVSFHIVDIGESERISLAARVEEPTVVLYSRGRELVRLYGGFPEQIEYLVSRALCGLENFWGLLILHLNLILPALRDHWSRKAVNSKLYHVRIAWQRDTIKSACDPIWKGVLGWLRTSVVRWVSIPWTTSSLVARNRSSYGVVVWQGKWSGPPAKSLQPLQ